MAESSASSRAGDGNSVTSSTGVINFSKIPMPVFDAFKQVFIVTDGTEAFYMDLDGEHDRSMANIFTWSAPPISVRIVRPFLVGLLQN